MAYSYQEYTGDGSTSAWTFSFTGQDEGYLRDEDLKVTVDDDEVEFTLTSANTFSLSEAPSAGSVILIRRVQDASTTYSDFRSGNVFSQENLNNNFLYLLYLLQQTSDGFLGDDNIYKLRNEAVFLKDVSVEGATIMEDLTVNGAFSALGGANFGGDPLKNVGKGESSTDAATVGQLEDVAGSTADALKYMNEAEAARDGAVAAMEASGIAREFPTYAKAKSATDLEEGDVVVVVADETRDGMVSRYRYEGGELLFTWQPGTRNITANGVTKTQQKWAAQILEPNESEVTAAGADDKRSLADWMNALRHQPMHIATVEVLRATPGLFNGQPARLISYHDGWAGTTFGPRGGGVLVWDDSSTAVDNGVTVFAASGANEGRWIRQVEGTLSVYCAGARGDGVTDDHAALQAAHNLPYAIHYPAAHYIISNTIQALRGQCITGEGGGRFADQSLVSKIECSTDGIPAFAQHVSTSPDQENGATFDNLCIIADEGIRFNNLTDKISDGASASNPYIMRPSVRRVTFKAKTAGIGIGLSMAKCFDWTVEECEFADLARELILLGCDIGSCRNNRFVEFSEYAILELAVSSFGSQNIIADNDFVHCTTTTGTFIKSTSHHVRISNNYLEQTTNNCLGFIDVSKTNVPVYGDNTTPSTTLFTVEIDGNRLDGHHQATGFIYRYEPNSTWAKIHDPGTTGQAPSVPWLTVVNDYLPIQYNAGNLARYSLRGGRRSDDNPFSFFESKGIAEIPGGVMFDAESLTDLSGASLRANNAQDYVRLSQSGIVLLPGLGTTLFQCILPSRYSITNPWLRSDKTYNIKIVARSLTGSATLNTVKIINGAGQGATVTTSLDSQNTVITTTMTGTAGTGTAGVGFHVGSSTNPVVIQSVSFEEA